jgi:CBS domain containing-hemolysin-like protein
MAQPDGRGSAKRALRVGLLAFVLAVIVNWSAGLVLSSVPAFLAMLVVLLLILVGVAFDILGTAVTSAAVAPLHAMAARKVAGARQGIWMAKNAGNVANFCNDVVGDVTGAVTGAAGAAVALRFTTLLQTGNLAQQAVSLAMVGLIAALTVGGKAAGKRLAIERATDVLLLAGRAIWAVERTTGRRWTSVRIRSSKRRST